MKSEGKTGYRRVSETAIQVSGVCKAFERGKPVLSGISFTVDRGEMVALIGASGSGKSTLIRSVTGLVKTDRRDGGTVTLLGSEMQTSGRISAGAVTLRSRVGVVFQQFNLVSRLTLLTNVLLGRLGQIPYWRGLLGRFTQEDKLRAMTCLKRVGIEEHALKRGSELSGGQQQRAAIARALLQGAEVLIADEPIASLDPNSARRVMDILSTLNSEEGITVLVSLHQVEFALRYCPRTIALRDGRIVYDGPSEALTHEFLGELYGAESKELFLPGVDEKRENRGLNGKHKRHTNGRSRESELGSGYAAGVA